MNRRRLIFQSLWHYRRTHIAVALGVAAATTVITGALLIGGSVRSSLRQQVLERLGAVDLAMATQQPFRQELAKELAATAKLSEQHGIAAPAFALRASLSLRGPDDLTRRASDVSLYGVTEDFGRFNTTVDQLEQAWAIPDDQVWLTPAVAEELGAKQDDEVLVRLPAVEAIPSDSPLGEKSDTTVGKRLIVGRILPERGLAKFSLSPTQRRARNAFVSLATAQATVDLPGKANLLLAGGGAHPQEPEELSLSPSLADYGLSVEPVQEGAALQLESQQLVLNKETAVAALRAFPGAQPVVTYLANTIRVGDKQIAYSTVAGVDSTKELGPLLNLSGEPIRPADDEIVLNRWAADQLGAKVGDVVSLAYYEPESTHGQLIEAPTVKLKLAAIVELADADGQPTRAADPQLTPEMQGVTDAQSINDWDLPFELVEPITQADEDYWDNHSTTPKAFVSLSLAKRLWSTRWGTLSLIRLPNKAQTAEAASKLQQALDPADMGFAMQPVKQLGLQAASGTTPFDALFMGFSMFLIASAVMLVALLFRLAIDQRAREIGLLSATGWPANKVRNQLLGEGLLVARTGAGLGMLGGVAYAWLMILGLRTIWVDAVVTPFLRLHVIDNVLMLPLGFLIGLMVACLTIAWTLRGLSKQSTRSLLAGQTSDDATRGPARPWVRWAMRGSMAAAVVLALAASGANGEAQAGMFFGSGALLLFSLVLLVRDRLLGGVVRRAAPSNFHLWGLALRNVARSASRSLLTIALVASASFIILAISAFRLPPSDEGTGGYSLVAQSAQPLHFDLNTAEGRDEYGFSDDQQRLLEESRVLSLRVNDGEDASCLNLYQTRQPRVLGVPPIAGDAFAWAAPAYHERRKAGAFRFLLNDLGKDKNGRPIVPVILDLNTAMYSLKLYKGVGEQYPIEDSAGRTVTLQVVALLKNSMLQGDLLVSEERFLQLFPESAGHRLFLIDTPQGRSGEVAALLEDQLSDYGLDAEDAKQRLAGFLAVQNTYLSTFQSLGVLGLLLGVVGVAVVQLRNVEQRRGELALLRAAGFTSGRTTALVLRENLVLLLGGLLLGAIAALVALAPQTTTHDAQLPWRSTLLLLLLVGIVGITVGWLATRRVLRGKLLPMLRGE